MTKRMRPLRGRALCLTLLAALMLAACADKSAQALQDDGRASIAKKDFNSAVVQLKGALQKDPKSLPTRQLLSEAMLASGDAPGAVVELTKVLEQGGDVNKYTPMLADALVRSGDFKRLVQTYGSTRLVDKDAQGALLVSMAAAWTGLSDPGKAAAALADAAAVAPESTAVVLVLARQMAGEKKFAEALDSVDKLLQRKPDAADAWSIKGGLLAALGQPDNAEQAFKKALEIDKTLVAAHFSLVNLYLRANKLDAAAAQAQAMKAALPRFALSAFAEAQIAFNKGDYEKARDVTQDLMRQMPNNVGVLLLAGTVALQSRDLVQAETNFSKVLQIEPEDEGAKLGLARVYLDQGQPARTLTVLQPVMALPGDHSEALMLAGNAQLALGEPAAAEALFTKAKQSAPDNAHVKTALAQSHMSRGLAEDAFAELAAVASSTSNIMAEQAAFAARLQRGEYEPALALVDQIAKKQPDSPIQHEMRARVYLEQRDYVKARAALEAQSKADPKNFGAIANLAALDLIDKKPDEARKRLQAAAKADPKNPYPLLAMADLQNQAGAPVDEVKQLLAKAIEVAPQLPPARLEMISLTLRKRLYKDALVAAQEALAALPNDSNVIDAAGRAQMEAGDVEQATKTFRQLAGASTTSGLAYTRLADIYKATGRRDLAESALRKALDVEPGMASAQTGLVDLLVSSKRDAEALELIRRMQRENPRSVAGYSLEATYQLRVKNAVAAATAYRNGIASTGSPELAQGLYRTLQHDGKGAEADAFGAAWIKSHPADTYVSYQMSEALIGAKQYDKAEVALKRLVGIVPDNVFVLNNLAYVLVQRGAAGALPYAEKAAQLASDYPPVLDTLASAQAAEKQFDKALATQKRAIELAPKAEHYRLHLAQIALQSGDKTLAKSELTRLKDLGAQFGQQQDVSRLLSTL